MRRSSGESDDSHGGDAVSRLLEAERGAREAVGRCEQEAAEILNAARAQARQIAARTDTRISAVHIRCDLDLAQRLAALRTAARQITQEPVLDAATLARLKVAVELLARRLTFAEPE